MGDPDRYQYAKGNYRTNQMLDNTVMKGDKEDDGLNQNSQQRTI
jgi:hypothetical protein